MNDNFAFSRRHQEGSIQYDGSREEHGRRRAGPEALEEAAAGASGGKKLKVTRATFLRSLPGKDCVPVGSVSCGAIIEYRGITEKDERNVAWYSVKFGCPAYISSKCCEFI